MSFRGTAPIRPWLARHLKPLVLGALTITAYVTAVHRTHALPWAVASLLAATMFAGIAWPHWLIRRLSVTRSGPGRANEGEVVVFNVEIQNSGYLPRFMIEIADRLPFVGSASGKTAVGEQTLGVVAYVPRGTKHDIRMPLRCEQRGLYRLGPVALKSSFPLDLAEVRQQQDAGVQTLVVYPDVFPIVTLPLRGSPSQIHRGGYILPEGAGAAEFAGLREYRRGDNPRHIHWPTTARTNELTVKEFEPLASACLCLALDLAAESNVGGGRLATFEYAVRIAGSVARWACANNIRTRLVGNGKRRLGVAAGTGDHQYQAILDELAVVAADGDMPYAALLTEIALDCLPGETVMLFLAEPAARTQATLQAMAQLKARGAHLFAVLLERATFDESGDQSSGDAAIVAGLADLGAQCIRVRRNDDLIRIFNP